MSVKLIGPLYDLSARGELFRRFCFSFLKAGISFTIKIVAEEESKVAEEDNINALQAFVKDDSLEDLKAIICFSSLTFPYVPESEKEHCARKIYYYYQYTESGNFTKETENYLSMYNEFWCNSFQSQQKLSNFNVYKEVIPVPVFEEDLDIKVKLSLDSPIEINNDTLIFYSIGRFTEKNNLRALLEAYWSAFTITDNVCLVLKTYIQSHKKEELNYIHTFIDFCMKEGGYIKTPNLLILHDIYPRKFILGLHQLGLCYIDAKRGDYLGINKLDASLFGNFIIQPVETSSVTPSENSDRCILFDSTQRPVFSEPRQYFYPRHWWLDAKIDSLVKAMHKVAHLFNYYKLSNQDPKSQSYVDQKHLHTIEFLKSRGLS